MRKVLIIICLLLALAFLPKSAAAQAPQINLSMQPQTGSVEVGGTLEVNVALNASRNSITTLQFEVRYDKAKLELVSFAPQSNGLDVLVQAPNNQEGYFQYAATNAGTTTVTGEVKLGMLRFKALAPTDTPTDVSFAGIFAGSFDDPELKVGGNRDGKFTINPTLATTQFRISETLFARNDDESKVPWQPYSDADGEEPVTLPYEFKDKSMGVKTIFVQFKNNLGQTSRVYQKSIRYIGPGPVIENLKCGFDSATGTGSKVEVIGKNFGEKQGRIKVIGQTEMNATITSWGKTTIQLSPTPSASASATPTATPSANPSETPTETPTATPFPSVTGGASLKNMIAGAASETRDKIVAKVKERMEGTVNVEVTVDDGRKVSASCAVDTNTITFTAQTQCRPSGDFSADKVKVQIYEKVDDTRPMYPADKKPISLDQNGDPQWTHPKLEVGKTYVLVLKGPKSVAIEKEFTVLEGTTVVTDDGKDFISFPVGDIAPLSNADNVINTIDFGELVREWNATSDVARVADFNGDSRVNSLDYSCMVANFNKSGARFLKD